MDQARKNRYVSSGSDLIVVNVFDTIEKISKQLAKRQDKKGRFLEEIQRHPALAKVMGQVQGHYSRNLGKITKVAPLAEYKHHFSPEHIRDIHYALISYTIDTGPYRDFNQKTRDYLTGRIGENSYPYTIYLWHIWAGLAYFYEPGTHLPPVLYRGITASAATMKVGQVFAFPSAVSFSGSLQTALSFSSGGGAIFRVRCADTWLNSLSLKNHSLLPHEDEHLLEPTHAYKVVGIGEVQGRKCIDLIVVRGMSG